MKKLQQCIFWGIITLTYSAASQGQEYLLSFAKSCSTEGSELAYECKKSSDSDYYIHQDQGVWKVRGPDGKTSAAFKLLRDDENILVLEEETHYSGNQVLYIMKKNDQFYLLQVAYSDILINNESTTKQGTYIKIR